MNENPLGISTSWNAAGVDDGAAIIAQATRLGFKGLEVEYIVFEDEGHGFAKPANRLKFYGDAERFLAKHMGGRSEDELAQ